MNDSERPWWEIDACLSLQRWHESNDLWGGNVWLLVLVILFAILYTIDTLVAAAAVLSAAIEPARQPHSVQIGLLGSHTKTGNIPPLTNCRSANAYSDMQKAHPSERIGLLRDNFRY